MAEKLKTSIERKMRRQLLSMSNGTVDLLKDKDFVRENPFYLILYIKNLIHDISIMLQK